MESPFPPRCRAQFEAVRPLASGAFGAVYLAKQVSLDRMVAVKLLHAKALAHPKAVRRFLREARIAAALKHPHIVQVVDHDFEEETEGGSPIPWIAYEFV